MMKFGNLTSRLQAGEVGEGEGMNRRKFLIGSVVGMAGLALMPNIALATYPINRYVLFADGVTDDTKAFQALVDGCEVYYSDGKKAGLSDLENRTILVTDTIKLHSGSLVANGEFSLSSLPPDKCLFEIKRTTNLPALTNLSFRGIGQG